MYLVTLAPEIRSQHNLQFDYLYKKCKKMLIDEGAKELAKLKLSKKKTKIWKANYRATFHHKQT